MKRLTPSVTFDSVGRRDTRMVCDPKGKYVSVKEVYSWLKRQRNSVPMTGEEAAEGFLEALREGE